MLAQESRCIALVQAVAAKHARISADEAAYILWNETCYPFGVQSDWTRQVRAFFGEFRGGTRMSALPGINEERPQPRWITLVDDTRYLECSRCSWVTNTRDGDLVALIEWRAHVAKRHPVA